jgi:uncharacterized membrane protein YidH (DUF202 family)
MSKKRLYFWIIYLAIVTGVSAGLKYLQTHTDYLRDDPMKSIGWVIYGIVLIVGYRYLVLIPRNNEEQ